MRARVHLTAIGLWGLLLGIVLVDVPTAVAESEFRIHQAPEIAIDAEKFGGAPSARLRNDIEIFPYRRDPPLEGLDIYGENFEVDVSESAICRRFGFLRNRITGIVYPRFYKHYSVEAALNFAAARVAGNPYQRGSVDADQIAVKVREETQRIAPDAPKSEDRLIPIAVGQNERTQIYFYSRADLGTANLVCQSESFYKRCTIYGNLPLLGFATTIRKDLVRERNVMTCFFLAFERVSREALPEVP